MLGWQDKVLMVLYFCSNCRAQSRSIAKNLSVKAIQLYFYFKQWNLRFFEGETDGRIKKKKCHREDSTNPATFFFSMSSNWVMIEVCQKVLRKFVKIVETSVQFESLTKFYFM